MQYPLVISQEFFQASEIVKNIPKFVLRLKTFFSTNDLPSDIKAPRYKEVKRYIESISYPNFRETLVVVPAGLNIPLIDYIPLLEEGVEINQRLLTQILKPFDRWLGQLLSHPEHLRTLAGNRSLMSFEPSDINDVKLNFEQTFLKGSTIYERLAKEVFRNNSEVKLVFDLTESLVKDFNQINRIEIIKQVDDIASNLGQLMNRYSEGDTEYQFGHRANELLSKIVFSMAQEVEFYGFMNYQLKQLTVALDTNVNKWK